LRYVFVILTAVLAPRVALPAFEVPPVQRVVPTLTYVCPMDPDVRASEPGKCPKCGMALVPLNASAARRYTLDVSTTPQGTPAGHPFRLHLKVRDAYTGDTITKFTEVHEKRFHLFVIGQDLEHYDHVHPDQQPDGSWALDVTVPRPGYYKLFADFLPEGGTPQVLTEPLVTAGFTGDLSMSAPHLVADKVFTKSVGSMVVELALPKGGLVAGTPSRLVYRLTDATTGAPVRDVEPYLGAWGHTLIMSANTEHYVHAHPNEHVPHGTGGLGGPQLTFNADLPAPGTYRIWTQIQRNGVLSTVVFTVPVDKH
jgi:hypothetical protein